VFQEEAMRGLLFSKCEQGWCHRAKTMVQAAVVVAAVSFALPGSAADQRAVKSKVPPVYPELAKRMRIEGTVKIEATVDAAGKVTDVKTLNGSRALSGAAEEAVRKWKFAVGDGEAKAEVEVTFNLAQ
jgi:TonB family protein